MGSSHQDLSKMEKEELLHKMEDKAREYYQSENSLTGLIIDTLKGFGHRYFESTSFESKGVNLIGDDHFEYVGVETSLVEALKCSNSETKKALIEFAKKSDIKKKPAVQYCLGSRVLFLDSKGGGEVEIYAEINWNFPIFSKDPSMSLRKKEVFSFDDPLLFRNQYASILERVCELF